LGRALGCSNSLRSRDGSDHLSRSAEARRIVGIPPRRSPGKGNSLPNDWSTTSKFFVVRRAAFSVLQVLDGQSADLLTRYNELHDLRGAVADLQPHDITQ